jgi:hypothetical protein
VRGGIRPGRSPDVRRASVAPTIFMTTTTPGQAPGFFIEGFSNGRF